MDLIRTTVGCAAEHWAWRIGDPYLRGWAIVALYLLAGIAAFRAARRTPVPRERWFWRIAGLVSLALAVNKQLDLQTYIFQVGRCAARIGGWYDLRRSVEALFFVACAVVCLVAILAVARALRRSLRRLWPALLGLGLMTGFVLLRAMGFTHVDAELHFDVGATMRVGWLIEAAAALILLAGSRYGTHDPPGRARRAHRLGKHPSGPQ